MKLTILLHKYLLFLALFLLWLVWHRYESPYVQYPVRCAGGEASIQEQMAEREDT